LENKRKNATKFPRGVLKRKNQIEEGGNLGVGAWNRKAQRRGPKR
jgi:hypothetical protein